MTEDEVKRNIDRVRNIREDIPIGIFLLVAVGDNEAVKGMRALMGKGYLGTFMGPPQEVASSLESLEKIGISRVQLTEFAPDSHDALAPLLTGK